MSRLHHKHFVPVAPLPGEPDPDLFWPLGGGNAPVGTEPDNAPPSVAVDTSREAAAKITKHTARIREAIFLWLKTQGSHGATAGEICTALGLSGSTVRPRLVELRGVAKWAPGLPARIQRSPEVRKHMHVYIAL